MSDFKAKMHQIRFPLGLCLRLDPAGGAYRAPLYPLAVFKEPTSTGKEREGEGREWKEKGKGSGEEGGRGP